ncbi:MAG: hypothetical protein DPW16_00280 [Chloroflexi bacterium]|nr:hypothetical protein [Chloroflexota bacterium]
MSVKNLTTKEELFAHIQKEWDALQKTLARIDRSEMEDAGVCGEWSVKDILAHLFAWQEMVLNWYTVGKHGDIPKTPSAEFNWQQLPQLNQRIYEQHHERTLEEVLGDFYASHRRMLEAIGEMSAEEMFTPGYYKWTKKLPFVSYLGSCTSSHYNWANKEIRKWKKS